MAGCDAGRPDELERSIEARLLRVEEKLARMTDYAPKRVLKGEASWHETITAIMWVIRIMAEAVAIQLGSIALALAGLNRNADRIATAIEDAEADDDAT